MVSLYCQELYWLWLLLWLILPFTSIQTEMSVAAIKEYLL